MIHDAIVLVTCDGCHKVYIYSNISLTSKFDPITQLAFNFEDAEWVQVGDLMEGKHYCSQECADEAEDGKA